MATITNGVDNQASGPEVSPEMSRFIQEAIVRLDNLNNRLLQSGHRNIYKGLMEGIDARIARQVARNKPLGWSPENTQVSIDPLGVPYRKDGTVMIVISDKIFNPSGSKSTLVGGKVVKYQPNSLASFDARLNRIIIHPFFADISA